MPGWQNSHRREQLPRDWPQIRRHILHRDPTCQRCWLNASIDVDHIGDPHDHTPENLQGLCRFCHQRVTIERREANRPQRNRPPEEHPGITNPMGDTQ